MNGELKICKRALLVTHKFDSEEANSYLLIGNILIFCELFARSKLILFLLKFYQKPIIYLPIATEQALYLVADDFSHLLWGFVRLL